MIAGRQRLVLARGTRAPRRAGARLAASPPSPSARSRSRGLNDSARRTRNSRQAASPARVARPACLSSRSLWRDSATSASSHGVGGRRTNAGSRASAGADAGARAAGLEAAVACRRWTARRGRARRRAAGRAGPTSGSCRRGRAAARPPRRDPAVERDARQAEPGVGAERHRLPRRRRPGAGTALGLGRRGRAVGGMRVVEPPLLEGQLAQPVPRRTEARRGGRDAFEGGPRGRLLAALLEQQRPASRSTSTRRREASATAYAASAAAAR